MKIALPSLLLLAAAACIPPASAQNSLQPNDFVALTGDSITQQHFYTAYVADYLQICKPEPGLSIIQFGVGGETAGGLASRVQNDVLPFRPTVATTCYGMNDGGYAPISDETRARYRDALERVVAQLKQGGVRFIVVGTPGAVDTKTFYRKISAETYNQTLKELGEVAREVAAKNGAAFADVHSVMVEVMARAKAKLGAEYPFAGGDGVHPGPSGHIVMAYAFLKALGCKGDIATITVDMKNSRATATEGTEVLSFDKGVLSLRSARWPFCFTSPDSRAMLEFLPFNEDLNRYLLVVKNASARKFKVTWGKDSKEFTAEQLASGVNLAAEFLDNPFFAPFVQMESRIKAQQELETQSIKGVLHMIVDWRRMFPEDVDAMANLRDKVVSRLRGEVEKTQAAIKPVDHSITIAPIE